MKTLIAVNVCLQCVVISMSAAQSREQTSTIFDVFPLIPNLHYSYNYYSESRTTEVVTLVQLWIDSGAVEYIVHDSLMTNDSTIAWNLEERQTLWHRRYDAFLNRDSIYWTYDTLCFALYENVSGNHELRSSGIVWDFPLASPTQSIYRFADSTSFTLTRPWSPPGPPGSGSDTLLFSDSSGFFYRHRTFVGGAITHVRYDLRVQLQGNPVVSVQQSIQKPSHFTLSQNYPNPFNPSTTIDYTINERAFVSLRLYDLLGKEISVLDEGVRPAGLHSVTANLSNLSSGAYFYQLHSAGSILAKKLLLLK